MSSVGSGSVEMEEMESMIQEAFIKKDAALSRRMHDKKLGKIEKDINGDSVSISTNSDVNPEAHKGLGDYIKSIIFGGLDGTITTFALIAGIQGAKMKAEVVIILGFANLISDGISMGIGDYLSESSELEYISSERRREEFEFENYREGEVQEMIQIYLKKGIIQIDAELILRTMAKYKDFFINHMMVQELELQPPSGHEVPMKNGAVTLLSFLCFGTIPILSYVIFLGIEYDKSKTDPKFFISIVLTVITLFSLGVFKAKLTDSSALKSGMFVAMNGIIASGAAYLVAFTFAVTFGIDPN